MTYNDVWPETAHKTPAASLLVLVAYPPAIIRSKRSLGSGIRNKILKQSNLNSNTLGLKSQYIRFCRERFGAYVRESSFLRKTVTIQLTGC